VELLIDISYLNFKEVTGIPPRGSGDKSKDFFGGIILKLVHFWNADANLSFFKRTTRWSNKFPRKIYTSP
jgi:hypothetical protein